MTAVVLAGDFPSTGILKPAAAQRTGDDSPPAFIDLMAYALGRRPAVLVVYPSWKGEQVRRLIRLARSALLTDRIAGAPIDVPPLALSLIADQLTFASSYARPGVLASLAGRLCESVRTGAWVNSVAHLEHIKAGLDAHMASYLPGKGFAVSAGTRPGVHRITAATGPRVRLAPRGSGADVIRPRERRRRMAAGEAAAAGRARLGRLVALCGAKGGVGATTLAVHVAVAVAGAGRTVCLVEMDLQKGDLSAYLDVQHRHSIADLAAAAGDDATGDLDGAVVAEALYAHPLGPRLLLAPAHGEDAEEISARASRRILTLVRSRFDVVIVDGGSHLSDAGAVAVEVADEVVVVATPDVPALRSVKRLTGMWGRLAIRRPDDVSVLLAKHGKRNEIQPDLARKLIGSPLRKVTVPPASGPWRRRRTRDGRTRCATRTSARRWDRWPPTSASSATPPNRNRRRRPATTASPGTPSSRQRSDVSPPKSGPAQHRLRPNRN
ncbi:CpaE family protein [Actinomadura sp. 9N215]|uniref:CpaE family protein n=1 Tax=Actinomadura sp. 9N215 TaxID=3375150 RepID=UPI0037904C3C